MSLSQTRKTHVVHETIAFELPPEKGRKPQDDERPVTLSTLARSTTADAAVPATAVATLTGCVLSLSLCFIAHHAQAQAAAAAEAEKSRAERERLEVVARARAAAQKARGKKKFYNGTVSGTVQRSKTQSCAGEGLNSSTLPVFFLLYYSIGLGRTNSICLYWVAAGLLQGTNANQSSRYPFRGRYGVWFALSIDRPLESRLLWGGSLFSGCRFPLPPSTFIFAHRLLRVNHRLIPTQPKQTPKRSWRLQRRRRR